MQRRFLIKLALPSVRICGDCGSEAQFRSDRRRANGLAYAKRYHCSEHIPTGCDFGLSITETDAAKMTFVRSR